MKNTVFGANKYHSSRHRYFTEFKANHNSTNGPLFLYVAHAACHSSNPYNPLPVPDNDVIKMGHIPHYKRRKFAGKFSTIFSFK